MPMLSELIRGSENAVSWLGEDTAITALATDSREVSPGTCFIAIPGIARDGAEFIPQAVEAGASAVVTRDAVEGLPVSTLVTAEPRLLLAHMAARFYPRHPKFITAVTGTNGKTSTADFFRQLWQANSVAAASLGTLGLISDRTELNSQFPQGLTSPDPIVLHRTLQQLHDAAVQHLCVEASSHGIDQHRLDGVKLRAAAFTNLTRDHLDYHGSEENYFTAKAALFDLLLPHDGIRVINADDPRAAHLLQSSAWSYGHKGKELRIESLQTIPQGLAFRCEWFGRKVESQVSVYGTFQLHNILAAVGLAMACGMSRETAEAALPSLRSVRGRMQRIGPAQNGAMGFVDYAHTPDALEQALKTLRAHQPNKLHVVFGCGGDRDAGKRPLMGQVAAQYADHIIVTDDNPRSENPASIRTAILQACPDALEIGDRGEAIYAATQQLKENDILLVAGKGHENYQIIGERRMTFDDAIILQHAMEETHETIMDK